MSTENTSTNTTENVESVEVTEVKTEVPIKVPENLNPVDPNEVSVTDTEDPEETKRRLSVVLEAPETKRRTTRLLPDDVPIPNPNTEMYKYAYKKFKETIQGKEVSAAKMLMFVAIATQITQDLKRGNVDPLSGAEKKAIVINMIKQWVDEAEDLDPVDKEFIKTVYIPCTLEGAIESLCELNVNKVVKKKCNSLLSCICGSEALEK